MKNNTSRRNFIKKSVLSTGLAAVATAGMSMNSSLVSAGMEKLPREVWIASFTQQGISAQSPSEMLDLILAILDDAMVYKPDIVCLPETFSLHDSGKNFNLEKNLEISEITLKRFSGFARKNNCYTICPVYVYEGGKTYNTAVFFNRDGSVLGKYFKIHITEGEIENGLTPGPLTPQVFQTDFGKTGIQICFDILWDDGWNKLREQGAEMVFWPSAYSGGQVLNTKAWMHKYVVVSSTRPGPSKICDISGEVLAQTGRWDKNVVCAPVNLEKVFLHTWPFVQHFDEIRKKYGRKVKISTFHEEEWSVIESLSPEVFVADIIREFNLKSFEQHVHDSEIAQIKSRGKG